MNSCKTFSKNHPVLLSVLAFVFMFGLLKLMGFLPEGPLNFACRECIMAAVVFAVTFLFMGKEKVSFSTKGFSYGFRMLRGYFIVLIIFGVIGTVSIVALDMLAGTGLSYQLIPFINVTIACLFVGIVEESVFRGLIFGALLQKLGNAKKSIILAAVISGLLFGVLHVLGSLLAGEVTDTGAASTAILKIFQCAIMGFILAFIYYKTRNLYVVAALHSLDDFLIFVGTGAGNHASLGYVGSDRLSQRIIVYVIFTLILVPSLIRCIRDITPEEAIPFDEDFLPREAAISLSRKRR